LSNLDENGAGTSAGSAGTKAIDYLRSVYQNPLQPDNVRMKAASIAIEYELPRLAVTATFNGGDFADQLDRANERSRRVINATPLIEATPQVSDTRRTLPTSDGHKPTIVDRRYRSW
jgi:hypothetical protein